MRNRSCLLLLPLGLLLAGCAIGRTREAADPAATAAARANAAGVQRDAAVDRLAIVRWTQQRMQDGVLAYERGEYDAAIRALREVVDARPQYLDGHLYLAKAYRARGSGEGARASLARALKLDRNDRDVRVELASLHLEAGRHADALALLEPVLGGIEGESRALTVYGETLVGVGRDEEAQACFRRALQLDPSSEPAFRGVIAFQALAGNRHEVERMLHQAAAAGARVERVLVGVGDDCWARGLQARALAFWQECADRFPQEPGGFERLGTACVRLGHADEAVTILEPALSAHPADAGLRFALAEAQAALGRHDVAALHLRKLLQAKPEHGPARLALAREHRARGDVMAAIVDLTRAIARNPADPQLHDALAAAYRAAGEPELAASAAQVARKLDPEQRFVRADTGR